jgi:D-alanine-D-alanine ligase
MDHKAFVSVFIPYCTKNGQAESSDYDTPATRDELAMAFDELSLPWKWQPITFENLDGVIGKIGSTKLDHKSIVLNFCDGDEINGFPGISVVRKLEKAGITFTGADTYYYYTTTSKILMKEKFYRSSVNTPPYRAIKDLKKDVAGLCAGLGTPLIVKPAISAASWGITLKSIVNTDEEIGTQAEALLKGRHGCVFTEGSIFVERFINGPEFTALIVGSSRNNEKIKVYPPVERVFNDGLPLTERLLSYERYWGVYDQEPPLPSGMTLYTYRLVHNETLRERIGDLSSRAYLSVGGCGYGRVDIRMDQETGELFVLEVNSNCGISSDNQTSVGQILRLSGGCYSHLLAEILDDAVTRQRKAGVDR